MQQSPVAVPDKIFGLTLFLDFTDRYHSLSSLHPPPAALASLPLPVYRCPPGGYNPSVSFADSSLYTREPLLLRKMCALSILIAAEPMLEKLDRIKVKYGLVE